MENELNLKTAALILNGSYIPPEIEGEYILCADGGYNLLQRIGKKCDAVIGDLDSAGVVDPEIKQFYFDKNKNETDGHLGILHLYEAGFERINIYGALGGRADQVAGNIGLLAIADSFGIEAVIYDLDTEIYFADKYLEVLCEKGDTMSVIPHTDNIVFKESSGLIYPLKGLNIKRLTSQGISNLAVQDKVTFTIKKGKAYVYRIKQ